MSSPSASPSGDKPTSESNLLLDSSLLPDLAAGNAESYTRPGELSEWEPGDTVTSNNEGSIRKSPNRNKPQISLSPAVQKSSLAIYINDGWALWGFNALVFVSSTCVMTLELTASRLIAKHVGSSLYTWTSVIGVVLAGITLGNYLGGWLADRYNRSRVLSWMYLLASLCCASVLWLDQLVAGLPRPESFNWPAWILCVVSLIFLLPALLLGTTSPLVASMALARSCCLGMTVGNVYAWGALGSIVGTFLTGFYLIDVWGTRSIIGLTAGVLAALAVVVASERWVFRTAVLYGWLQLLGFVWMSSSLTSVSAAAVADAWGRTLAMASGGTASAASVSGWKTFGSKVGQKLHELGILLRLRNDRIGNYHDESSYSYITVGDISMDGDVVRFLQLDKLHHSFYNPDEPTKLYYEYEQIYAAVTKRLVPRPERDLSIPIPEFPGWETVVEELPDGVRFDLTTRTLNVATASASVLDQLLKRSSDYDYWSAVEELHRDSNQPRRRSVSTVSLTAWPTGLVIPQELSDHVRYDPNLEVLSAHKTVSSQQRRLLLKLSPQAPWREAVESLRRNTAPISTLFLGGGGYIFPRWILTEFPGATQIDVAELDPGVHRAVQLELGLTQSDEERIHTTLGDARNFVDDRLRANACLRAAGQAPVLYNFIYGDAFNDYGVPFHLTTREFTQKLYDLMTDRGVFLQNIIEIYPRTRVPGSTASAGRVAITGAIPEALFVDGRSPDVRAEFRPLKVTDYGQLEFLAEMSPELEQQLNDLAPQDMAWTAAIQSLAAQTRSAWFLPLPLPRELHSKGDAPQWWTPCPKPFRGVETFRIGQDQYALGFRGAVSDELRNRLLAVDPDNAIWVKLIQNGVHRSRAVQPGRFLARYTLTMTAVFPCVYLFSTSALQPDDERDTFVVVCAKHPLNLSHLSETGLWNGEPFAGSEKRSGISSPTLLGQMDSLLQLAEGQVLTDDFAPVENLLRPVFVRQND